MEHHEQGRRLRQELEKHRGELRYPRELAAEVMTYVRVCRSRGQTMTSIGDELRVPLDTLYRWLRTRPMALVPVTVVPAVVPRHSGITVHGPRGLRIEDLSVDQAAELWRSLS